MYDSQNEEMRGKVAWIALKRNTEHTGLTQVTKESFVITLTLLHKRHTKISARFTPSV